MPELPDVENYKQYIDSHALNQKIEKTKVLNTKILDNISKNNFSKKLKGQKFTETKRIGKNLFVKLSKKSYLLLHFGMTGQLEYTDIDKKTNPHTRVCFLFDSGKKLQFVIPRMLGKATVIDSIEKYRDENKIGTDALEISKKDFIGTIENRRGAVKSFLMNQKYLSGIGNIYADEILFNAKINPAEKIDKLNKKDFEKIYKNIHKVLKRSIEANADPAKLPGTYLLPHRGKGEKCPRCKGKIKTKKVGGRTTYFCPNCQPKK